MKVVFHHDAILDISGGATWYAEQAPGLGGRFISAIESSIVRLRLFPEKAPLVNWTHRDQIRRVVVLGFPISVFYGQYDGELVIFAVSHHKQSPRSWELRTK